MSPARLLRLDCYQFGGHELINSRDELKWSNQNYLWLSLGRFLDLGGINCRVSRGVDAVGIFGSLEMVLGGILIIGLAGLKWEREFSKCLFV